MQNDNQVEYLCQVHDACLQFLHDKQTIPFLVSSPHLQASKTWSSKKPFGCSSVSSSWSLDMKGVHKNKKIFVKPW